MADKEVEVATFRDVLGYLRENEASFVATLRNTGMLYSMQALAQIESDLNVPGAKKAHRLMTSLAHFLWFEEGEPLGNWDDFIEKHKDDLDTQILSFMPENTKQITDASCMLAANMLAAMTGEVVTITVGDKSFGSGLIGEGFADQNKTRLLDLSIETKAVELPGELLSWFEQRKIKVRNEDRWAVRMQDLLGVTSSSPVTLYRRINEYCQTVEYIPKYKARDLEPRELGRISSKREVFLEHTALGRFMASSWDIIDLSLSEDSQEEVEELDDPEVLDLFDAWLVTHIYKTRNEDREVIRRSELLKILNCGPQNFADALYKYQEINGSVDFFGKDDVIVPEDKRSKGKGVFYDKQQIRNFVLESRMKGFLNFGEKTSDELIVDTGDLAVAEEWRDWLGKYGVNANIDGNSVGFVPVSLIERIVAADPLDVDKVMDVYLKPEMVVAGILAMESNERGYDKKTRFISVQDASRLLSYLKDSGRLDVDEFAKMVGSDEFDEGGGLDLASIVRSVQKLKLNEVQYGSIVQALGESGIRADLDKLADWMDSVAHIDGDDVFFSMMSLADLIDNDVVFDWAEVAKSRNVVLVKRQAIDVDAQVKGPTLTRKSGFIRMIKYIEDAYGLNLSPEEPASEGFDEPALNLNVVVMGEGGNLELPLSVFFENNNMGEISDWLCEVLPEGLFVGSEGLSVVSLDFIKEKILTFKNDTATENGFKILLTSKKIDLDRGFVDLRELVDIIGSVTKTGRVLGIGFKR